MSSRALKPVALVIVAAVLLVSAAAETRAGDVVESSEGVRYSRAAYEAGRRDAQRDIRNNRLVIEIYGGPPSAWEEELARLLRQRYGIELRSTAGCVVDHDILGHARGYNEVSRAEIVRRFGGDVAEATKAEVKKRRRDQ